MPLDLFIKVGLSQNSCSYYHRWSFKWGYYTYLIVFYSLVLLWNIHSKREYIVACNNKSIQVLLCESPALLILCTLCFSVAYINTKINSLIANFCFRANFDLGISLLSTKWYFPENMNTFHCGVLGLLFVFSLLINKEKLVKNVKSFFLKKVYYFHTFKQFFSSARTWCYLYYFRKYPWIGVITVHQLVIKFSQE